MPPTTLLLWILTRSLLLPHEPVTLSLATPGNLPAGTSVAGLIETGIPAVTSDRFDASGAGVGTAAKIGAYGESWTETTYRIGNLEATNPLRPGTAMVLPDGWGFESVSITAAGSEASLSTPGARVALTPQRPADHRTFVVEGALSPASWAPGATTPPAITALQSLGDGGVQFSGPLSRRIGATASLHSEQSHYLAADRAHPVTGRLVSATGSLVASLKPREELRAFFMAQHAAHPATGPVNAGTPDARDRMGLAELTWERQTPNRLGLRVSGGYQAARLDAARTPGVVAVDSVRDGAVLPLLLQPLGTAATWRAEAEVSARPGGGARHRWRIGISAERDVMHPTLLTADGVAESVNGTPARVWLFDSPGSPTWRQRGASLYAADRISAGNRLTVDGSVRVETLRATNGSGGAIAWTTVYPRGLVTLALAPRSGLSVFVGGSSSGDPVAPMALAFGDPLAPSGRVYRWTDSNGDGRADPGEYTTLVARMGPGAWTAGASQIDANLPRPRQLEGVFGVSVERSRWTATMTGIVRRQRDMAQVVDTGAGYAVVGVADDGLNYPFPPTGVLTAYDRDPATFGLDQYALTTAAGLTSHFEGVDASLQLRSQHAALAFGATAARTAATALGRGFRVDENDPGLLDLAGNPNALVNATGRPFFDRGYTGKIALVVHLPARARLGALVRYQDGQPFSRLADVTGLSQGAEPIGAYARGRTRFTFVSTVDLRFQKTVGDSARSATFFVDVFDLLNASREVEEVVATTPAFRSIAAIEPPRTARLGVRVAF